MDDKFLRENDFKLCYIENKAAWFTTQDVIKQWGDDWNDAPYEHNAGNPYTPNERDEEKWELLKVYYEGPYETPEEIACGNSPYSVEMINKGAAAWLVPTRYAQEDNKNLTPINAGTSLSVFVAKIIMAGGEVYLCRTGHNLLEGGGISHA